MFLLSRPIPRGGVSALCHEWQTESTYVAGVTRVNLLEIFGAGRRASLGSGILGAMEAPARVLLRIDEVASRLGVSASRVRRLLEEHQLAACRTEDGLRIPEVFLDGPLPRSDLRGTLILLSDNGFSADEQVAWLLETDDALGIAPIDALIAGRKAEVRRVAQALA